MHMVDVRGESVYGILMEYNNTMLTSTDVLLHSKATI